MSKGSILTPIATGSESYSWWHKSRHTWSSHQCQCYNLAQNSLLWSLYAMAISLYISIVERIMKWFKPFSRLRNHVKRLWLHCPIYIACGYTDLRRGIDGLASIVQSQFQLDPFQRVLFLFCWRRQELTKGLYWEEDGFLLQYKRLENGAFQWLQRKDEVRQLTPQQYR